MSKGLFRWEPIAARTIRTASLRRGSVSQFHQKATNARDEGFFDKGSAAIAHAFDERNGGPDTHFLRNRET